MASSITSLRVLRPPQGQPKRGRVQAAPRRLDRARVFNACGAAPSSNGGGEPPSWSSPPLFRLGVDRQNEERVRTMTDAQLEGRLRRMRNVAKIQSFMQVLEVYGKEQLAREARQALTRLLPAGTELPPPHAPLAAAAAATDREGAAAASSEPGAAEQKAGGTPAAPPAAEARAAAGTGAPSSGRPQAPAATSGSGGGGVGSASGRSAGKSDSAGSNSNGNNSGGSGGVARKPPVSKPARSRRPAKLTAAQQKQLESTSRKLGAMGMEVYLPRESGAGFDWGALAGYEEVKRQVEDNVILALSHPEVYEQIARATRLAPAPVATNRPRAVLFEGPPGTGKTTCARVIAQQGSVPLVEVRVEAILSKWYGEDEKRLGEVLTLCEAFPRGAVVFLDELDSFVTSRDEHLNECTRRMLGILLRHIDGLRAGGRTVFVGATNRKADLDPALRSRFSATVRFDLPDEQCRAAILRQHAKHLGGTEVSALAKATPGMSGRDLVAVCDQTERRWAAEVIKGRVPLGQLPSVLTYLTSAQQRHKEMRGGPD